MTLLMPLNSLGTWIFSMIVDASALCGAMLLAVDFSVVPRIAPFRLDITFVAATRPEPFISDIPNPALTTPIGEGPVIDALSRTTSTVHRAIPSSRPAINRSVTAADGNRSSIPNHQAPFETTPPGGDAIGLPPPATLPQEPRPKNPTSAGMRWLAEDSARTDLPPHEVQASNQSYIAMEPSVPMATRLVSLRATQFRPTPISRDTQADYGWLANVVASQVERIPRYSAQAEWLQWEDKVVVQPVIREDGHISDVEVLDSSGHDALDHDAIALLERISPMQLQHPFDQSSIVARIPIGYRLE